jgi:2-phospho-L-lactate transferase/gluconeogenesis factor (CofD/UPF0052 family)
MTEPGETDGYTALDHVEAIRRHVPDVPIHDVLLNSDPIPRGLLHRYDAEPARPVPASPDLLRAAGCRPVARPLMGDGPKIRHDAGKLGRALVELATVDAVDHSGEPTWSTQQV